MWLPWPRRDGSAVRDAGGMGDDRDRPPDPVTAATPRFRYTSPDEDSARWWDFPFRPGDIVVSTRSKSGTTWVQMICLLLVYGTPDLPGRLGALSPWLDHLVRPADEVFAAPGRAGAAARHQDAHPARRRAARRPGDLHRGGPPPARRGGLAVPPRRQHRPPPHGGADGEPRDAAPAAPAAARVAAGLRRLGGRPPRVARHPAGGHAASLRRLGPPARAQRRAGALRRPGGRPRRLHARRWRRGSVSPSTRGAGPDSSVPPPSRRCGSPRARRPPTRSAC